MDVKSLIILKIFCFLTLYFNPYVEGNVPFGLCADPVCSVPLSEGIVTLNYVSPDSSKLSVYTKETVTIYVKDYGPKKDLLGIEVRGKKGYVSKQFIKETSVINRHLVPAVADFRDFFVTGSNVVTSQVHHYDSVVTDGASTTFIHTEAVQGSVNSLQNDFHQEWINPSEYLQSSHVSSQFPSNEHAHSHISSESIYYPEQSSHPKDPSENLQSSHVFSQFPSNEHAHSHISSESIYYPEQSSHFDLNSGNILSSSDVTGLRSDKLIPLQSQTPDMRDSYVHHQNHIQGSQFLENDYSEFDYENNVDFLYSKGSDYNPIVSTKSSDFGHQSVQQSSIHHDLHSSYDDSLFYTDEELSQTYSALNKMGLDRSGIPITQPDPNIGLFSQSNGMKYDETKVEINSEPSQAYYHSSIQNNDASFQSNTNFNPTINEEEKILNSETVNNVQDSVYMSTKDDLGAKVHDSNAINEKVKVTNNFEKNENMLIELDDEENEILAEEEYSDDDGNAIYPVSDKNPYIKLEKNIDNLKPDVESSMNIISASTPEKFKSTLESSNIDNLNVHEIFYKKFGKFNEEEISPFKGFFSSSIESSHVSELDSANSNSETISSVSQNLIEENTISSNLNVEQSIFSNTGNPSAFPTPTISDEKSLNIDLSNQNNPLEIPQAEKASGNNVQGMHHNDFHKESTHIEEKSVNKDVSNENNQQKIPPDEKISESNFQEMHLNNLHKEDTHSKENVSNEFESGSHSSELNETHSNLGVGLEQDISSTYQTRNLKGEYVPNEDNQSDSESGHDENNTEPGTSFYITFENGLNSIKSIIDSIMTWVPEPLYSAVMDLESKGISPRVPVFTTLCGFLIIFLIVPIYFIKEWSKEGTLSAQLANIEKKVYTLSTANIVLEEKLECSQSELSTLQASINEERNIASDLRYKFEKQTEELENLKSELEGYVEEFESLREKENEYLSLLNEHSKEKEELIEHKNSLEKIVKDQEDSITNFTDQLQESENIVKELEKEKIQLIQLKEDYEEKLAQFELNCNQLLQEAEVWNLRVNELTSKLSEEKALKEEVETSLRLKDEEIESLKQLVETFNTFDEIEDPEDLAKTKEEKLQTLMKSSMISNQLKKREDEYKILDEQLGKEKSKVLEMEVEMLEAKSEIDKLKINYNQALQDKAEAQTKLDVLTNYFKDKEIQLQRQLGAQEAVRQKKEDDVNSAERRICLIEQENASYKSQVASMKQEMEETERNLKSQIAVQEKKAHENWIAARAAERKLEDMKQEVTQLRQRLTLLEREQENWANSSRDEILKPVPKRIPGTNEESGSQDLSVPDRSMFHPPLSDRLPPPIHMMLPPDRPLPPLPPIPPMFLPPIERHFRPQPWHIPPDPSSEFRTTPPEFITGRESTPPRGRPSGIMDGDAGPHASSPLTTDARDSRNSTPPHLLPDFHDVPPQPGRPFFPPPPPLGHPRLHMHPSYRRDAGPGHKRLDNPHEYNSRGSHQPSSTSQEQWQHSRV